MGCRSFVNVAVLLLISLEPGALTAQWPGALPLRPPGGKIVNGLPAAGFPSVGLFSNGNASCTATLIGCSTLLTAAHCVCTDFNTGQTLTGAQCLGRADLLDPTNKSVYFHHAGLFAVASVTVHPGFVFAQDSDLAILKLSAPVSGIAPSPLDTTGRPPAGTAGVIVGFGITENPSSGAGIKRAGALTVAPCAITGVDSSNHVCATLNAPLGDPGTNSGTCFGDSGGPLFVDLGAGSTLAGTTSGGDGASPNCTPLNHFFFADVFKDRAWIASTAGGDLGTSSCGGLPAAGGPNTSVSGATGRLSLLDIHREYSFPVPAAVTRLRIGLTSEDYVFNDFNLYVKRGSPPTTSSFDCKSDGPGTLELCDIPSPAADTWHVLIDGELGLGGPYELVTTLFSQAAGAPCLRDAATACLRNDRFEVKVSWNNNDGNGLGKVMSFADQRAESSEAAFYYFQTPTNFELGLKVLNACSPALGNKFWVFISGLTDQGWQATIRDTQTGAVKVYTNARGHLSTTLEDLSAFDCP
jgi:hypothetical protein